MQRGAVNCNVGSPKTLARRKPIPLAHDVLTTMREFRKQSAYGADSDWIFASPVKDGETPYRPDSALERVIKPAVKLAGISKTIGWNTFQHSCGTRLRANHSDVKVQSELLRHSNVGTTLNVYSEAVSDQKPAAHGQVVKQLLSV